MNAMPPSLPRAGARQPAELLPGAAPERFRPSATDITDQKWVVLQQAAAAVAALASVKHELDAANTGDFPARIQDAGGWRREQVESGIADLAAIMEFGLAALLAVRARGGDAAPAALALWREFDAGQKALLALIPPKAPGD